MERELDSNSCGANHRLQNAVALSAWSIAAAFGTYFCMYGFRKPFTSGSYSGTTLWGLDYKTVLVIAQVFGYMLSKFIGIKVISEIRPQQRAVGILILISLAWLALLLFAVVRPPFNAVCLFLNGVPLGMVFGLVLGFLEGRRVTEALTAGLCASFILADGVTKSIGAYLLQVGVTEYWMPFAAGSVFALPLVVFVAMLAWIPAPSASDVQRRTARVPMAHTDRRQFFGRYAMGLGLLAAAYLLVTVLRSVRADFAPEIWEGLLARTPPAIFAQTEMIVMLGVVLANGLAICISNNRLAFHVALGTALTGLALVGVSVTALRAGWIGGFAFMTLNGLGLYLPYVAVHTTIFERLIAMTRERGNIGYLMYLVDAFGYLGYVAVLLGRTAIQQGSESLSLSFFNGLAILVAVGGILAFALSWASLALRPERSTILVTDASQRDSLEPVT